MLDVAGLRLEPSERELLRRPAVGGLILFGRNYESPAQLRALVDEVRGLNGDLLIAVDQEGGRVQRFRDGFLALPSLREIGLRHDRDPATAIALARQCGWAMAAEVLHFGIDISFAPVLDRYSPSSKAIGDRAFSSQPDTIHQLATSYIRGMREAGMVATGKHFPGHGTVSVDSHHALPVDRRTAEEILADDYRAFADCIRLLAAIMPAHVVYPAVDDVGAGFSKIWLQGKLRGELGFDGVIFSDDLSMAAAGEAGDVIERASLALAAGCDMILVCNDREGALRVCEWVESQPISASSRLASMRASPAAEISELYSQDRWLQAEQSLRAFSSS